MEKSPISVVVLAKNEQANLPRCLNALGWADEVVVVDDQSEDETARIANELGARVLQHPFESFAKQRNWALREGDLRNEWVLLLDADEVSTPEFAAEVTAQTVSADRETVALKTCRKTMMDGKWLRYSDGFPVWIMRVVRRGQAWFEDSGHGEVPMPKLDGSYGEISEPFLHFPFSRGMDDWWRRHTLYAGREARKELARADGEPFSSLLRMNASCRRRAIRRLSASLPARGSLRFFYQYILKRGFLDGRAGYRFCRMMACYESMIAIRKMD
ncbi:MAG: glycosyltransferase family 2 protein [Planctomycetota bacterium]